ncbi:DinB family protein [Streptomyces sp. enrichment culture]|uniref:DinB family protein n=1 Tax=Streptomyces sp. enrichment culture TaxID=1795815 RepID=UPI003F5685F9
MADQGARTDRLGLLLDQFDQARETAEARLTGLGDAEYLWEPVAGCWSVRRREEATTSRAYGPGEWVLDKGAPDIPALAHLRSCFAGQWEWTFGERRRDPRLLVHFTPSAAPALERFRSTVDRRREGGASVTDEQLDTIGFSQYPYGSGPHAPYIAVVAGASPEFIHHMAEIALLRDLWRARLPARG